MVLGIREAVETCLRQIPLDDRGLFDPDDLAAHFKAKAIEGMLGGYYVSGQRHPQRLIELMRAVLEE